ncbi:acyl carrier protein [Marinobacter daepoensis]|uniref:Acyl carrier protein n=1 Tax=Marinobacter daepoensis TaxID=262077 RepID=A0ABS3BI92_9GAMM|nr:acyl carrier protein [Marinobacter daepoensis]MBN7771281.1 acyl carrier protein [Marinobacter daepoensis]MBY6079143.1 acyl carrier protein [Marinobacter daepoensis]
MITEQQVKDAIIAAGIDADVSAIGPKDNLGDHGIDSLDFFNLFLELEDVGGKKIPDEDIDKMNTIEAIIQFYAD